MRPQCFGSNGFMIRHCEIMQYVCRCTFCVDVLVDEISRSSAAAGLFEGNVVGRRRSSRGPDGSGSAPAVAETGLIATSFLRVSAAASHRRRDDHVRAQQPGRRRVAAGAPAWTQRFRVRLDHSTAGIMRRHDVT